MKITQEDAELGIARGFILHFKGGIVASFTNHCRFIKDDGGTDIEIPPNTITKMIHEARNSKIKVRVHSGELSWRDRGGHTVKDVTIEVLQS